MVIEPAPYLLDVNVLVALLDEDDLHHTAVSRWFKEPGLKWSMCAFTAAGLLRYMTRPTLGHMSMEDATVMVSDLADRPGYRYQSISADWPSLTLPVFKRLFGHKQVTDSFLLGLAIHERLVLATFDRVILHLAGEYSDHVLVLTG